MAIVVLPAVRTRMGSKAVPIRVVLSGSIMPGSVLDPHTIVGPGTVVAGQHLENTNKYSAGGAEHTADRYWVGVPARVCDPQPPHNPLAVCYWRLKADGVHEAREHSALLLPAAPPAAGVRSRLRAWLQGLSSTDDSPTTVYAQMDDYSSVSRDSMNVETADGMSRDSIALEPEPEASLSGGAAGLLPATMEAAPALYPFVLAGRDFEAVRSAATQMLDSLDRGGEPGGSALSEQQAAAWAGADAAAKAFGAVIVAQPGADLRKKTAALLRLPGPSYTGPRFPAPSVFLTDHRPGPLGSRGAHRVAFVFGGESSCED
eukprot:SAG22_NODE_969_length_6231_cov_4.839041_5_plen_317_part_00